jgi:hypothetical protein
MTKDMKPKRWLRAFPRAWRTRYGGELGALVDDLREEGDLRTSDRIDIVRSGLALRHHRVKRRSVYGALGGVVAAVFALVGLALAGTFASSPTMPPPPVAGRIVVLHAHRVPDVTAPITFCQVTPSTGAVQACTTLTPSRARVQPSGGSVTITVRSQPGSS